MRRRLAALDGAALERAVGDLLGDRERGALLARRDALLGKYGVPRAEDRKKSGLKAPTCGASHMSGGHTMRISRRILK
jgi:hypothetical protein